MTISDASKEPFINNTIQNLGKTIDLRCGLTMAVSLVLFIATLVLFTPMPLAAELATTPVANKRMDREFMINQPLLSKVEAINGKALGAVLTIFQSSDGFMWLGTGNGLIRYDGYETKTYRHMDIDPVSISGNSVFSIIEDKNRFLWIGTANDGLNKFDPTTETFEHIVLNAVDNGAQSADQSDRQQDGDVSINNIKSLNFHTPEQLTVVTGAGLYLLNITDHSSQKLQLPNTNYNTIVMRTLTDSKGRLWIATLSSGLYQYDSDTGQFTQFEQQADSLKGLSSNNIYSLAEDQSGNIWVGSQTGVNILNPVSQTIDHYSAEQTGGDFIGTLLSSDNGDVWIGSSGKSITRYEPDSKTFSAIDLGLESAALAIYEDRDHLVWIGTHNGLQKLNPDALVFKRLNFGSQSSTVIKAMATDDHGNIWLGGNSALYRLDEDNLGVIKQQDDLPTWRMAYHDNTLFSLGAHRHDGMIKFNTRSKTLSRADFILNSAAGSYSEFVESVIHEGETLWYTLAGTKSTQRTGLYRFDIATGAVRQVLAEVNGYDVIRVAPSKLLLATTEGLVNYNDNTEEFAFTNSDPGSRHGVTCIYQDSQQRIWLCIPLKGLGLFDTQTNQVTIYPWTEDKIKSITEDSEGYLWLAGSRQLARFDSKNQKIKGFNGQQKISDIGFFRHASVKTPGGAILLSTFDGLVYFRPNKLSHIELQTKTLITDFKMLNQTVKPRADGEGPLNKLITYTDEITLGHEDYLFSFSFATLDYLAPEVLQYAYKMEGLDKDWLYTSANNRTVTYTTLPPGDYTFRVKGNNSEGQWNEGSAIEVHILPPIWATTGSYVLYVILLVMAVVLYNQTRTKQLRHRAQILERGIEARTIELKQRADTITRLLEDKDRLFANISHEFRTPLTLILGPLEAELKASRNEKSRSMLSLAKANGQRLLNMVDQLLDLARLQDQEPQPTQAKNVLETCEFLMASYRALAELRQITLTLDDRLAQSTFVDMQPDALEKILSNLLTNAFKYSGDQQDITLTVQVHPPGFVQISVKDTGEGIKDVDLPHIFERFTRLESTQGYVPGAGIGLALIKDLVEQHKGTITVQSQWTQGSTFTVNLPMGEHQGTVADSGINEALVMSAVEQVTQNKLPAVEQVSKVERESDVQRANILVIEDHHDMRQYIVSCLSDSFDCTTAVDGEEGVAMARETLPDLIISDVMMPKMDGFAVTKALKGDDNTSHIPLILLTARGDRESRIKGWSERADEFLQKPFDVAELLTRIESLLSIRSLLRQRYQKEFSEPSLLGLGVEPQVIQADNHMVQSDVINTPDEEDEQPVNIVHQEFIESINQVLEKHYAKDTFDVALFSSEMALGKRQFSRKMKALLDLTPAESIRSFRLKKAAEQLASGISPSEVYHRVGFSSHSYFSQCFKAQYRCLPSGYLKVEGRT